LTAFHLTSCFWTFSGSNQLSFRLLLAYYCCTDQGFLLLSTCMSVRSVGACSSTLVHILRSCYSLAIMFLFKIVVTPADGYLSLLYTRNVEQRQNPSHFQLSNLSSVRCPTCVLSLMNMLLFLMQAASWSPTLPNASYVVTSVVQTCTAYMPLASTQTTQSFYETVNSVTISAVRKRRDYSIGVDCVGP
jgi:hypothetical protein